MSKPITEVQRGLKSTKGSFCVCSRPAAVSFVCVFQPIRCSRKMECQRHTQSNHWLWSYHQGQQCVSVQSLVPSSQSREKQTQVRSVPLGLKPDLLEVELPMLGITSKLKCHLRHVVFSPGFVHPHNSFICCWVRALFIWTRTNWLN